MSMTGRYRRISAQELDALRADPAAVPDFLYPHGGIRPGGDRELDVDRSWHALHFLLNGHPWDGSGPLFDAVLGGTEVGEEDVVYGPARGLTPEEVRAVADALEAIPASEIRDRFDVAAMNQAEIYPHGWQGTTEEREFLVGHYGRLVDFFRDAAEAGDAMLLYLA
jgi:hypothetical protein